MSITANKLLRDNQDTIKTTNYLQMSQSNKIKNSKVTSESHLGSPYYDQVQAKYDSGNSRLPPKPVTNSQHFTTSRPVEVVKQSSTTLKASDGETNNSPGQNTALVSPLMKWKLNQGQEQS